jgi:transcriptional regulator with XRE-family HTH domain
MDEQEGQFGGWLNGAMRRRGLSQAALARAVGVADTQVSRWRRGQVIPSLRYLQQIADTFGVPRHTLDRLAGYPVVAVSDGEDEGGADPAAQADMEAALAHFRDTLESRIPRAMWRPYAAACDALADAFAAADRARQDTAEDAPAATMHEAREARRFGFQPREVGATLVPPGMPPAPLPGGPGGPMPLPGGPSSPMPGPMPGPTDLPAPPAPLTPPTPQPLPPPLIEPEPFPAPGAPDAPDAPTVLYDR